jgi:hypothetical protein
MTKIPEKGHGGKPDINNVTGSFLDIDVLLFAATSENAVTWPIAPNPKTYNTTNHPRIDSSPLFALRSKLCGLLTRKVYFPR